MPTHAETRVMPYSAEQMYDLIADVGRYPEFLPWCGAARMRSRRPLPDGTGEVLEADLVISFKVFRERFGSRVTLRPAERAIDVEYLDGPFRYLQNRWLFRPLPNGGCEIDFFIEYELKSMMLGMLVGALFDKAFRRFAEAFEERARQIYVREQPVAQTA